MKAKTTTMYALVRHERLDESKHGNACWDCDKALGIRVTIVCRGVDESGKFVYYSLCPKCGDREKRENETGRIARTPLLRRLKNRIDQHMRARK